MLHWRHHAAGVLKAQGKGLIAEAVGGRVAPSGYPDPREPLALVAHGFMGDGRNWTYPAQELSRRLQQQQGESGGSIVAVDMRNHGLSPHYPSHRPIDEADDLFRMIEERSSAGGGQEDGNRSDRRPTAPPGDAVVMGHSMGGAAVMTALLADALFEADPAAFPRTLRVDSDNDQRHRRARRRRLRAAVIVDSSPVSKRPPTFEGLGQYLHAMMALTPEAVATVTDADMALKRSIIDPAMRNFLLLNFVPERDRVRVKLETTKFASADAAAIPPHEVSAYAAHPHYGMWRCNLPVLHHALLRDDILVPEDLIAACRLRGVKVGIPVLFVYGALSPYNSAAGKASIPELFSDATIIDVPDAGHVVHADQRELFCDVVAPFLSRHFH